MCVINEKPDPLTTLWKVKTLSANPWVEAHDKMLWWCARMFYMMHVMFFNSHDTTHSHGFSLIHQRACHHDNGLHKMCNCTAYQAVCACAFCAFTMCLYLLKPVTRKHTWKQSVKPVDTEAEPQPSGYVADLSMSSHWVSYLSEVELWPICVFTVSC